MIKEVVNEDVQNIPLHVAIIMDGNGRWAEKTGLPRIEGHRVGAGRVREIVEKCLELGIKYLSIYAFSKENWKRPSKEVNAIMKLAEVFFSKEFRKLRSKGVYFVHLGDREDLPGFVIRIINNMQKNNAEEQKMFLNIAFNYSGRSEMVRACRCIGELVRKGEVDPEKINEKDINQFLYTSGMPDPDLLIRTGGEMRLSNFLLWQMAYAEIWVTDILWPDFNARLFQKAIDDYANRKRRFGNIE
jgi:undecaprenyl diphosphate synthase